MSRRSSQLSYVAALVAVMLLSFAGVRSTVMQAATDLSSSMPECGMGRMAMRDAHKGGPATPGKTCSYCAVAAHAPLLNTSAPVFAPTSVAWTSWPPVASLGARGPPAFEARARGPPDTSINA